MKILTLQITKKNFDLILSGEQKTEQRHIYPTTSKRYFENPDDGKFEIKKYDALRLINGRKKDAPELTVLVKSADWFILTDENGDDIVYEENGQEYLGAMIEYSLGEVIESKNIV